MFKGRPIALGAAVVIAIEQTGRSRFGYFEGDVADDIISDRLAIVVDDLHVKAGHRLAHRAVAHLDARSIGDNVNGFSLAVAIVNGGAGGIFPDADCLRVEWFARADGVANR